MGDIGLSIEQSVFNYDLASFLTFWALNMRDNQVWAGDAHPAGSVSDTVPHTFGSYPADPAWGTAYPAVVYQLWRQYGAWVLAGCHRRCLGASAALRGGSHTCSS
jgi:alpha-L-rhamnosidase